MYIFGKDDHFIVGCKRKEEPQPQEHLPAPKKPRLVFTDLQRRTLQAIFKVSFYKQLMYHNGLY